MPWQMIPLTIDGSANARLSSWVAGDSSFTSSE